MGGRTYFLVFALLLLATPFFGDNLSIAEDLRAEKKYKAALRALRNVKDKSTIEFKRLYATVNLDLDYFAEASRIYADICQELKAADCYNEWGIAYMAAGMYKQAKVRLQRAVELDGDLWEAHANLGRLYIENKPQQAEQVFSQLSQRNPGHLSAYIGLGNIHFAKANSAEHLSDEEQKHLREAKRLFEDGLKVIQLLEVSTEYVATDKAILLSNLGAVEGGLQNHERAKELLESSLELDPNAGGTHYNVAQTYHRLGDYDKACNEYKQAIESGRDDEMTQVNCGAMHLAVYLERGERSFLERAEEILHNAVTRFGCSLALENLCSIYFLRNQDEQVKASCEEVLLHRPQCPYALAPLVLYYERTGQRQKAAQTRDTLLKIDPDNFDANYDIGLKAFGERQWDQAIEAFQRCGKPSLLSSNLIPNALIMLARCYKASGHDEKGFEALTDGLKRYPNNAALVCEVTRLAEVRQDEPFRLFLPVRRGKR